eukprot:TRINITY_DN4947_c0_g1_i1.p1 TRINITY_DN4947_c0_g1~~TRINITY_DN4947_c0_g1_i1.p1  ORF type:complete len:1076 (-),score=163.37 TRINITY_DN4947_c0_g1_i1:9-3236(-)
MCESSRCVQFLFVIRILSNERRRMTLSPTKIQNAGPEMPIPIAWSAKYSVTIPLLDSQHKRLFEQCEELRLAISMEGGAAHAKCGKILRGLAEYCEDHFETEECLMKAVAYSEFPGHVEGHREFIKSVFKAIGDFEQGNMNPTDLLKFLYGWLTGHIMAHDKQYAQHIRDANLREFLDVQTIPELEELAAKQDNPEFDKAELFSSKDLFRKMKSQQRDFFEKYDALSLPETVALRIGGRLSTYKRCSHWARTVPFRAQALVPLLGLLLALVSTYVVELVHYAPARTDARRDRLATGLRNATSISFSKILEERKATAALVYPRTASQTLWQYPFVKEDPMAAYEAYLQATRAGTDAATLQLLREYVAGRDELQERVPRFYDFRTLTSSVTLLSARYHVDRFAAGAVFSRPYGELLRDLIATGFSLTRSGAGYPLSLLLGQLSTMLARCELASLFALSVQTFTGDAVNASDYALVMGHAEALTWAESAVQWLAPEVGFPLSSTSGLLDQLSNESRYTLTTGTADISAIQGMRANYAALADAIGHQRAKWSRDRFPGRDAQEIRAIFGAVILFVTMAAAPLLAYATRQSSSAMGRTSVGASGRRRRNSTDSVSSRSSSRSRKHTEKGNRTRAKKRALLSADAQAVFIFLTVCSGIVAYYAGGLWMSVRDKATANNLLSLTPRATELSAALTAISTEGIAAIMAFGAVTNLTACGPLPLNFLNGTLPSFYAATDSALASLSSDTVDASLLTWARARTLGATTPQENPVKIGDIRIAYDTLAWQIVSILSDVTSLEAGWQFNSGIVAVLRHLVAASGDTLGSAETAAVTGAARFARADIFTNFSKTTGSRTALLRWLSLLSTGDAGIDSFVGSVATSLAPVQAAEPTVLALGILQAVPGAAGVRCSDALVLAQARMREQMLAEAVMSDHLESHLKKARREAQVRVGLCGGFLAMSLLFLSLFCVAASFHHFMVSSPSTQRRFIPAEALEALREKERQKELERAKKRKSRHKDNKEKEKDKDAGSGGEAEEAPRPSGAQSSPITPTTPHVHGNQSADTTVFTNGVDHSPPSAEAKFTPVVP